MPDKKPEHTDTRTKREQRGFYHEKQPGFYDVKASFDRAARRNPETAMADHFKAGALAALAKFGLLLDHENPVDALTKGFKDTNEGMNLVKSRRAPGTRVFWSDGPPTGQASVGDRVSPGFQQRGGIEYGGV